MLSHVSENCDIGKLGRHRSEGSEEMKTFKTVLL